MQTCGTAEPVPRQLRSLGFGLLACVNAVGDTASSLYVGYCLQIGRPALGFAAAAACGAAGSAWLLILARRRR